MRRPWSELLSEAGLTPAEVERALERVRELGGGVDTALLELDLLPEETITTLLGLSTDLPTASLEMLAEPSAGLAAILKQPLAEKYGLAPLSVQGRQLTILVHKAVDLKLLDEVAFAVSRPIRTLVATELRVRQRQAEVYGRPLPERFTSLLRPRQGQRADRLELTLAGEDPLPTSWGSQGRWGPPAPAAAQAVENVWRPRTPQRWQDRIRAALTPRPGPAPVAKEPKVEFGGPTDLPPEEQPAEDVLRPRLPPSWRDRIRAALTPRPGPLLDADLPAPVLRPTPLPQAGAAPTPPPAQPLPSWTEKIRAALTPRPAKAPPVAGGSKNIDWWQLPTEDARAEPPGQEPKQPYAATFAPAGPAPATAPAPAVEDEFDIDLDAEAPEPEITPPAVVAPPPESPAPLPPEAGTAAVAAAASPSARLALEEIAAAIPDLAVAAPQAAARGTGRWQDAAELLRTATSRDAILSVALAEARGVLDFVAIFVRRQGAFAVFEASGRGASGADLQAAAVPFERPSALRTVWDSRQPYLGPVPAGDPLELAVGWMGRNHLQSVLLFPVAVRDRSVLVLYGDNDGKLLEPQQLYDLAIALAQVPAALERVLVAEKQRSSPTGRGGQSGAG